jgi:hypothetical protein
VFLNDHVAKIDADAEPNTPLVTNHRLTVDHPALHLDRTAHRINDTRKFCQ